MSTKDEAARLVFAAANRQIEKLNQQAARAIALTGGNAENLDEALDQWENERAALAELFDENQALTISFRHYDITMKLAEQIINTIELDAAMFMTQKSRDKIAQFREQMQKLEQRRAHSRELMVEANNRRNSNEQHV